jgi:hypothetical protein
MKKAIKILSIIAIALSVLALLCEIALLFVFWEEVCSIHMAPESVIAEGAILPVGNTVYIVGCMVLAIVVYICSKSSKSIMGEIVSIIMLSIILPIVVSRLSFTQTKEIANTIDSYLLAAFTISRNTSALAHSLTSVAATLCYVVCGISISEKIHLKKITSTYPK